MLERPTRHPLQTPRTCRFAHLGNHSEACEHSNLFVPTLTSTDQALRLRHCAEEMAGVMSLIAFRGYTYAFLQNRGRCMPRLRSDLRILCERCDQLTNRETTCFDDMCSFATPAGNSRTSHTCRQKPNASSRGREKQKTRDRRDTEDSQLVLNLRQPCVPSLADVFTEA